MYFPYSSHPGDAKWIKEQLLMLPYSVKKRVCERYSEVHKAAYEEARPEHTKDCKARRIANTRLREFVEKNGNANFGNAKKPPRVQ